MPVTGSPAVYRRGFSFTQFSATRPREPVPGDRLDTEFDDIAFVLSQRAGELEQIVGADGRLRHGIVGADELTPGLFDGIVRRAEGVLRPLLEDTDTAAGWARRHAQDAGDFSMLAQRAAQTAAGAAGVAESAREVTCDLLAEVAERAVAVDEDEKLAKNASDTAEAFMVQAEAARDMAEMWSEYLAGPVQPAPPGWPEAIDDGMWSAKWWAVRASEIVGTWGNWYLGAFATAPAVPAAGPWPPGTLYFNTANGLMYVWDGTTWALMTVPGPSVALTYVYTATAAQTAFSGPDMRGATPAPSATQDSMVYVNGVRLVEDKGSGTGDFTINRTTDVLTIKVALDAGSIVHWDVLLDPAALAPQSANILKLINIDLDPANGNPGQIDGVRTAFPLRYVSQVDGSTKPATPGAAVQLQIVIDGVPQESGVDFTIAGSTLTFTTVLPAKSRFSGAWFAPLAVT